MFFVSPVIADRYVGGEPPVTVQNGIVSGDLWFDSLYGTVGSPGQPNSAEKSFSLPDYTEIKWARLYVVVYCGNMKKNYQGQATIAFDGGQGSRNLGTELLNQEYVFEVDGGITPVDVSGHCNRVTSDYLMWYDVTDMIKSQSATAYVSTDKAPGYTGSFDGRIKLITLVVAYDDGDNDEVYYWVNQGHDVHSYYVEQYGGSYTGRTGFETRDLPADFAIDSAKLGVVHLASENGIYTFNEGSIDTMRSTGSYSGYQVWDVTDSVYAGENSEMTYTRNLDISGGDDDYIGAFYKIPLAFLSVKHVGEDAGSIYVESNPRGAAIYIDDEEQEAVTDSHISGLPVGTYSVYVHRDSYYDPEPVDVEVVKCEKATVTFDLEPITGSIEISSEPDGANIILDDVDTGKTTNAVIEDVIIGTHSVVLSLDGYFEREQTVTVEEDTAAEISFELLADSVGDTEDDSVYGYTGKELEIYKKGSIEGGVVVLNASRYTGLLKRGDTAEYSVDIELPENAVIETARLYLYSTWGHDTVDKEGEKPDIEAKFDGNTIYKEKSYRDRKGEGIYNYILETTCYDVTGKVDGPGETAISVTNSGGMNDVFALYGASLVIVYSDPESPLTSYWIAEGCDALLASDEFDTDTESCTTSVEFGGSSGTVSEGLLYVVSTAASGMEGDENRVTFNDYEDFNLLNGGSSDISTAFIDAKPCIKSSGNELGIQSYVSGDKGDYMENRIAVLVLEHPAGTDLTVETGTGAGDGSSSGSEASSSGETAGSYQLVLTGGRTGAEHIVFDNGTIELYINEGTSLVDSTGMPVDHISIKKVSEAGNSSLIYDVGAAGVESDLPLVMKARVGEYEGPADPEFVYYPGGFEEGERIESSFDKDSGILSCRISRLGTYGIVTYSGGDGETGDSGPGFPLNIITGLVSFLLGDTGQGSDVTVAGAAETGPGSLSPSRAVSAPVVSAGPEVIEIDPTLTDFDVQICSNPSSAKIFIDGEYTGKTTPSVFTLRGGDHDLELELEDFNLYTGEFLVSDNTTIYADLQTASKMVRERKSDGYIEVSDIEGIGGVYVTSSPDGATVYINGYNTGMVTPCVFYGLKEGMNTIKVKKAKFEYSTDSKKVWIDSGCVMPVNFGVSLVYDSKADIDSIEYDGYYFTINGHLPEYKLPKVVAVDSANSFITFHEDGKYISHNIHAYYDGELNDIRPREYRFGKVLVESVPEGAEIYVDGYDTGYCTPYAIGGLSDGEHCIEVSKPGYIRNGENILLAPDESEYDAKLKIILESYFYGSLEVTSTPPGARIYLYKKDTGKKTPYTFRYMDIGGIEVKVVGNDQTVTLEDVTINPFETTTCNADLR